MKYRDCIVAWTPSYGPYDHLETVGEIAVGPHPDTTGWSPKYAFTSGAPDSKAMSDQAAIAAMLVIPIPGDGLGLRIPVLLGRG